MAANAWPREGCKRRASGRFGACFGLYAFFDKAVALTGSLLVGLTTDLTGSQRTGFVPIAVLFVIGFILLLTAPSDRKG